MRIIPVKVKNQLIIDDEKKTIHNQYLQKKSNLSDNSFNRSLFDDGL